MYSPSMAWEFDGGKLILTIFLLSKLLSLLPAKILRLLEWVGFSGDKVMVLSNYLADSRLCRNSVQI